MSKTFRRAAMSSICMLIVAVMSLTGATYAWFSVGTEATVTGMHMDIATAEGGIQIYNPDTQKWGSTLALTVTETGIAPVSTVDVENFFKVEEFDPEDEANICSVALLDNEKAANVITKTVKFRNTGEEAIYMSLGTDTVFTDVAKSEGAEAREASKAARLALVQGNVKYIYAPNDSAAYPGVKAASKGQDNGQNAYFPIAGDTTGTYTADVTPTAADKCEIKLPGYTLTNGDPVYAEVEVTIIIWLEGQDSDCVNENANSAFDIYLQFVKDTEFTAQ